MLILRPWTFLGLLAGGLLSGLVSAQDEEIKSISLRTHSLEPPYLDSDMQSRWFDFGGDTIVRTDRYIRLASDKPSRNGWLFSRVPLTATNWEITVDFKIHGQGNLYGDGMAMWLTKQRATPGNVFGSTDMWEGLGIFIDTYKNNRPGVVFPLVMAALGDGKTPYDKENDGKANELAGCSARGLRNANIPTKMRVTYFAEKSLKVELLYKSEDKWTECFDVPNVKLPPVTYLGFSAETGELSDNHDIISVQTKNLYQPSGGSKPASGYSKANTQQLHAKKGGAIKSSGGWGWFLIKFLLFGCVVAGGYFGFTMYRASRNRSRF